MSDVKKDDSKVIHIHGKEEFEKVTGEGITLVDFWATWCGPCRMITPVLEELAPEWEGKIKIAKVQLDVDDTNLQGEHQMLAASLGVQGIPNLVLFVDGEVKDRIVGAGPKPMFSEFLEKAYDEFGKKE